MTLTDHDRERIRSTLRILWVGALAGLGLALLVGVLGGSGRTGLAVMLLVTAAASSLGALHSIGTLLYDDLKDRDPARRRAGLAVGLFAAAALLMAMVAGTGG